jgi:hypothetical protein
VTRPAWQNHCITQHEKQLRHEKTQQPQQANDATALSVELAQNIPYRNHQRLILPTLRVGRIKHQAAYFRENSSPHCLARPVAGSYAL